MYVCFLKKRKKKRYLQTTLLVLSSALSLSIQKEGKKLMYDISYTQIKMMERDRKRET